MLLLFPESHIYVHTIYVIGHLNPYLCVHDL